MSNIKSSSCSSNMANAANNPPASSTTSSPRQSHINPFLSPTSSADPFSPSFDPSFFLPNTNSLSASPSEDCSFDEFSDAVATQNRLNQASFILQNQQLRNSYTVCLSTLHESIKQLNQLHQENDRLRQANADLIHRLRLLTQSTIQNCRLSCPSSVDNFNAASTASPTSAIEQNYLQKSNDNHHKLSLLKSISVRSNNYENTNQHGGSGYSRTGNVKRSNVSRHATRSSQKLYNYAGGEKREEGEAIEYELEVYNQGMQKTELCNKWQETGACPYADNCRFAHGIAELRPVIRHPRYKTEVCRMVLSGDMCSYGHRCHFRHSLDQRDFLQGR